MHIAQAMKASVLTSNLIPGERKHNISPIHDSDLTRQIVIFCKCYFLPCEELEGKKNANSNLAVKKKIKY